MTADDLVDSLAAHRTLGRAPRAELAWLAAHGTLKRLEPGDVLTHKGTQVQGMFIVLSGRIAIFIDRGAGLHKAMEWRGGDVTGLLPYSRLTSPPGDTVAQEGSTVLSIDRECMRGVILECHEVTSILVHAMLDRARAFTTNDLHDEKMISLGKLSAGLAHELNNPASAIERSARQLQATLEEADRASRALGAAHLTDSQLAVVDALHATCAEPAALGVRSPLERAAHEDALADWLADHDIDTGVADALAETNVTLDKLDEIARVLTGPALSTVVRWAGSGCAVRRLTTEIQEAGTRIAGLVAAIKGFTHMDQAQVAEPVDLVHGLSSTIAVLQAKARHKSVAVAVTAEPGLPRVRGFAGELNQIWGNLIDNALDAVPASGRVEVFAGREGRRVAVSIVDNGPGIPLDIRDRIFDPFFTTKPVGQGTGLGLDIVRRLVVHNEGEIAVESQPGRTAFRVILQPADAESGARA